MQLKGVTPNRDRPTVMPFVQLQVIKKIFQRFVKQTVLLRALKRKQWVKLKLI